MGRERSQCNQMRRCSPLRPPPPPASASVQNYRPVSPYRCAPSRTTPRPERGRCEHRCGLRCPCGMSMLASSESGAQRQTEPVLRNVFPTSAPADPVEIFPRAEYGQRAGPRDFTAGVRLNEPRPARWRSGRSPKALQAPEAPQPYHPLRRTETSQRTSEAQAQRCNDAAPTRGLLRHPRNSVTGPIGSNPRRVPRENARNNRRFDPRSLRRRKTCASKLISDGLWLDWRQGEV